MRALARKGWTARDATGEPLAAALGDEGAGVWLVRAGAWPVVENDLLAAPPSSSTGRPLCAIGAVRPVPGEDVGEAARAWGAALARTGGDLARAPLPEIASAWLDGAAARAVGGAMARGAALEWAIARAACRVVRVPTLDVHVSAALRVVQVVTSLQQGGAERVVLDLARGLHARGDAARIVTLGRPTRAVLPVKDGEWTDLSTLRGDVRAQAAEVARVAARFGADVVHAHLADGEELAALAAHGVPVVVTLHNARAGWPAGTLEMRRGDAAAIVACARAVEAHARDAALPAPVRTIWNGVDAARFARTPARVREGAVWRAKLGFGVDDFVLLAVANARPQKRLERLVGIVQATAARVARPVRLVVAGAPSKGNAAAEEAWRALEDAARAGAMEDRTRFVGSVEDMPALYAAADALVVTSAYEGLSLAVLEALAAGVAVVATDVGGTGECASPAIARVGADAPSEAFAEALLPIARREAARPSLPEDFDVARAVERHAALYARVARAPARRRRSGGVLLVTNNFSTGGAQSSARRLLLGLAARGVRARAAVLEEKPADPTPGARALASGGVPVFFAPPPWSKTADASVAALLDHVDDDPPDAVLLWNAMAEHKIRLVDGLLDVPVYDVSPGEMYFASLERYFAARRPALPYLSPRDYGARLAGVVVKYAAEAERAREALGAPVYVVPNGVSLDVPRARPRGGAAPLVIGSAARISPQKRLVDLVLALRSVHARMPPYRVRIAGAPELHAEAHARALRDAARDLPFEWIGEPPAVPDFLAGLDLFAMISEPAGCPNASLEAMAAALPVVATAVGGAVDQIEDGVSGRLVPRGDPRALGEAILELAHAPALRASLGAAARARAEARFDVARMVDDYLRVTGARA